MCRRELFVLDEEDFDEFDYFDEEEDDDEEEEEEEEEEEREAESLLTHEQMMQMLEDAWYKVFWLLGPHRQMVARGGRNVSEDDDDNDNDQDRSPTKLPLHSSTLLHSFVDIVAARTDAYDLNDATGFASGIKISMLACILQRMMAEQVKYIESSGGKEKVLEFPWEKAVEWVAPMRWIMQLR